MLLPAQNFEPPFNVTRTSHVVLNVKDIAASREFYEEVLGMVLTEQADGALYYRGIEEACHHSLVLRQKPGPRACARIGMRVYTEADLDKAFGYFTDKGCAVAWDNVPFQGRTLHITDPFGVELELCATMPVQPRMITQFSKHRGGCAQRIDHYQLLTPEVSKAAEFYMGFGFKLTEYIATNEDVLRGVFLQRKGNPHDIVFFTGDGPQLHHVAFFSPEAQHLLKACDIAGSLGFGRGVERGPGRHGPGHAMFVYFRDPDGHRIELFNTHYQVMDIENEPVRWDPADPNVSFPWGLPAQRTWFDETTPFEGQKLRPLPHKANPLTLERFLAERA